MANSFIHLVVKDEILSSPANKFLTTKKMRLLQSRTNAFTSHMGIDQGDHSREMQKPVNYQGGSTITQQLVKLAVFSTKKEDQTYKCTKKLC